jgi:endonuclease/exonuclease/phosphatase (EEP) superfamily protein YafD
MQLNSMKTKRIIWQKHKLNILLLLAIIICILVLGRFWFWIYPLELLTHFQVYYFGLSIFLFVITIWLGDFRQTSYKLTLGLILFALTLNGLELSSWYLSKTNIITGNSDRLRVMSFNINVGNFNFAQIAASIKAENPDILLAIEVTPAAFQNIAERTKDTLPFTFRSPGGGLGILSRFPLENSKGQKFSGSNDTNLVTNIKYRGKSIQITGVHPLVPVKNKTFQLRNKLIDSLNQHWQTQSKLSILMGDFNLTPWSPYYQKLKHKTNLYNTRRGFGILPTWIRSATHVKLPNFLLPFFNIPIDHIFVTEDIKVARTYSGDPANSDHTPIISDLVIANNST